ncbi:hypothetical protein P5V15_010183 [Pogonomyrmex californicus]
MSWVAAQTTTCLLFVNLYLLNGESLASPLQEDRYPPMRQDSQVFECPRRVSKAYDALSYQGNLLRGCTSLSQDGERPTEESAEDLREDLIEKRQDRLDLELCELFQDFSSLYLLFLKILESKILESSYVLSY